MKNTFFKLSVLYIISIIITIPNQLISQIDHSKAHRRYWYYRTPLAGILIPTLMQHKKSFWSG